MNTHIVTRDSLNRMLQDEHKRIHVIGHALIVLFNRQTESERAANNTILHNTIGFTGADARTGSLTAKYYLAHKTLLPWQVHKWMKVGKSGYPRIVKYWRQLDQAACARAQGDQLRMVA